MTLALAMLATLSLSAPTSASVLQTVDVSTGVNVGLFGNPLFPTAPGSRDDFWMVLSTPPSGVQPPNTRAWIVTLGSGWNTTPGTRPIFANNNNPGSSEYERCFCLSSTEQASLALTLRADNTANLYLNSYSGNPVVQAVANNTFATSVQPIQFTYTAQNGLKVGRNCVRVRVNNEGGPTGFALRATLQGFGAQDTAQEPCCRPGQAVFTRSVRDLSVDAGPGPATPREPGRLIEVPAGRPDE
jgi:hypothetical protein